MDAQSELLKTSEPFNALDENTLERLRDMSDKRRIQEGEILAAKGDSASLFFLLMEGSLLVALADDRALVMETPGDFIAMDILSVGGIYTSTLTALSNGSVLVFKRDDFLAFIQEDSPDAQSVMEKWHGHLAKVAPFIEKSDMLTGEYQY